MNASSPMLCLVDEGNDEVIALRLLQRRLHLAALYWHPTISLSISIELKRLTRPIEECSASPTACICKLSFLIAFAFEIFRVRNPTGNKAFSHGITRRTYILGMDLRAIARPLPFCSIGLWWFVARCGDDEPCAPCRVRHNLGPISRLQFEEPPFVTENSP